MGELVNSLDLPVYDRRIHIRKIRRVLSILKLDKRIKHLKNEGYINLGFCETQSETSENSVNHILENVENEEEIVASVEEIVAIQTQTENKFKTPEDPVDDILENIEDEVIYLEETTVIPVQNDDTLIKKEAKLKPKPKQPPKEIKAIQSEEESLVLNEIIKIDNKLKYYNLHVQELIRLGEIKRTSRGVYVTPEPEAIQHKKSTTAIGRVAEIIQNNHQAMTIDEILNLFNKIHSNKTNRDSLRIYLYALKKKGIIKRLRDGVYADAEFGQKPVLPS